MWIEVILLVLTVYILWQILKKPYDYPPGPWGLPLIGYIPLGTKTDDVVKNFNQKYGNIVSFRIGARVLVLIFDYKLMKEAFNGPDMVERPDVKLLTILNNNKKLGIIASNGEHWHNIRRFSLRHLRDLGMGKSKLVLAVQNEAMALVNDFKKQAGKAIPLPHSITVSVLNVIWKMVASKRYNLDDKEILEFENLINSVQDNFSRILLPDFFPWMNRLPKFLLKLIVDDKVYKTFSTKLLEFLKVAVDEHIKTLDVNDSMDFIDAYLIEMKNQEDDPSSNMSIDDLLFCIADLFGAGSETTTTTLEWCILYLASNPRIQSLLQKEIDVVLPAGTLATLNEKPRLPYTEAFIHEVLRHSSLISVGLFHMASVDTNLGGYRIPKGAFVFGVHSSSHSNPENFDSPEEFRPERFLNSGGKFVNPKEGFLPFGIGKRQCLGEALARMELFIFLTTMVQSLHFATPPGKAIDLTPRENPIMHIPKENQNVLVTIRSSM